MYHLAVVVKESVANPGPVELLAHDALKGVSEDRTLDCALHGPAHEQIHVVDALVHLGEGVYPLKILVGED